MNDIYNLNEKLNRIKDATDSIRDTLGMSTEDIIETVASGVSILQGEKEQLEYDLEHAEETVLNEYFNINLDNTTNWTEMQKQPIPYEVNGLRNLSGYFERYPFDEIHISGAFGKPDSIDSMFQQCKARVVDIPVLDTSDVVNFSQCFYAYGENAGSMDSSIIQSIIDDWDTSKGLSFNSMFASTYNVYGDLDLSHFDTSQANYLSAMFYGSNLHFIGYENWDVSKVNNFETVFGNNSGSLDWTVDLTNWYNNTNSLGYNLNLYGTFGWNYSRPQKILMPNIKNDYRTNTYVSEMFSYDYHLMYVDVSGLDLTQNTDGVYSMFNQISPWCAIIVKNNDSKQALLNYYSDFKQIYTKAEYEANDGLYTTFNLYIADKEGNDLANQDAHFVIQYQDKNEDWQDCWSNNGNQLYYPEEGYAVILPRNYKYRFQAGFLDAWSDAYDVDADTEQIDINLSCGPEIATFEFDLYDSDTGEIVSSPIDIEVQESSGNTYALVYEGETITLSGYGGWGVHLTIKGGLLYHTRGYDIYLDNQHENYYLSYKNSSLHGMFYWENGEPAAEEQKELRYRWIDYNTGEDVGVSSGGNFSNPEINWETNMRAKDIIEHQYKIGFECVYDGIKYADYILDDNDMDENGNLIIPDIILPTPVYGMARVTVKDSVTGTVLDPSAINYVYLIDKNNRWLKSYNSTNPVEMRIKVDTGYICYAAGESDYWEAYAPERFDIMEGQTTEVNIYLSRTLQTVITYLDENGNNVSHGGYVGAVSRFYNNGEQISDIGLGDFYPDGTAPAHIGRCGYNDIPTWDQYRIILYDDNEQWQYQSDLINYVEGQYIYNVTIQQSPIPSYTMTINLIDQSTGQSYNGPYSLEYWGWMRGDSGSMSGTGPTINFTAIADDYDISITNLDGYEDWSEPDGLYNNATITASLIPTESPEPPLPETVHATIYFNDSPTLVSFSYDGTEYEYEQTSAQTFELDVPPMQDLYIYAECEGYDPLDTGWSVQDTDFEASIDFNYHYTITVYDENGELISDGDENLEIYDGYWDETDHSNPFVIRDITPGSSFDITVSYPGYLTQTNSVTVDNNDDLWDVYLEPEEEPENAHVTIEFNEEPNSVVFYDNDTGFEYEYEQTAALTFELDVPIGITLNTQATCDGFEPIDDYMYIDSDDIGISLDFMPILILTVPSVADGTQFEVEENDPIMQYFKNLVRANVDGVSVDYGEVNLVDESTGNTTSYTPGVLAAYAEEGCGFYLTQESGDETHYVYFEIGGNWVSIYTSREIIPCIVCPNFADYEQDYGHEEILEDYTGFSHYLRDGYTGACGILNCDANYNTGCYMGDLTPIDINKSHYLHDGGVSIACTIEIYEEEMEEGEVWQGLKLVFVDPGDTVTPYIPE